MIYIETNGRTGSYVSFRLTPHYAYGVNEGDQIWSDGENIEIYEFCDEDLLDDILHQTENKAEFSLALRKAGFFK